MPQRKPRSNPPVQFIGAVLPLEVRLRVSRTGDQCTYRYSELMPPEVNVGLMHQLADHVPVPNGRYSWRGRWVTVSATCSTDQLSAHMVGEFSGWGTSPQARQFVQDMVGHLNRLMLGKKPRRRA